MAKCIEVSGHAGWEHDEGWGVVNTFDDLTLFPGDKPRKVHVVLPNGYITSTRYPAIYMNDGQTALFGGGPGGKSWRAGEVLQTLIKERRAPPVVLVAIHPVDRAYEYTHAPWFPNQRYGGLRDYAKYVAGPLKDFVDNAYAIERARDKTMVLGSSHGGLAAFYTAMIAPEKFGLVGALSASFWVGLGRDGSSMSGSLENSALLDVARPVLSNQELRPKLWIDWGERGDGGRRGAMKMAEFVERDFGYVKGKDLYVHADPIGGHDEIAWSHRLGLVVETFYGTP